MKGADLTLEPYRHTADINSSEESDDLDSVTARTSRIFGGQLIPEPLTTNLQDVKQINAELEEDNECTFDSFGA